MRRELVIAAIALSAAGCGSGGKHAAAQSVGATTTAPAVAPGPLPKPLPLVAKLFAPTHTPRAGAVWSYRVTAADPHGHPVAARITVQIIDPYGTPHAVQYAKTNRDIVNLPFRGTFRDVLTWPSAASGYSFFFRVVVSVGTNRKQLLYNVQPR